MGFPARRRDRPNETQRSPRAAWYDRNPVGSQLGYFGTNVAPHGVTSRASYTVPTGKKAFIMSCYMQITRRTAATTLGQAYVTAGFEMGDVIWMSHFNNTVGAEVHESVSQAGVLLAGQGTVIADFDGSTGGTMDYGELENLMEFDA